MSSKKWPSPKDLIKLLETKPKKARGRFHSDSGGHCCLGHYADLCGFPRTEQGSFRTMAFVPSGMVALPDQHWLFQKVSDIGELGCERTLQSVLIELNDSTAGFEAVIEVLKTVPANGGRKKEDPSKRAARHQATRAKVSA